MLTTHSKGIFSYFRLFVVGLVVLGLDQATKLWVVHNIEPGTYISPPPIPVIDNFLYIVHIHNTGAAWGQLSGNNFWLTLLAITAIIAVFIFRKHLELYRISMQYAFGLLTGGIAGNLIDRLHYKYVIDFLDFHLPGYRWPAFNIADAAITTGVILFVFFSFRKKTPLTQR